MNRLVIVVASMAVVLIGAIAVPRTRPIAGNPVPLRHYAATMLGATQYHLAVIGDSYTAGSAEGGEGPRGWTGQAWHALAQRGVSIAADVAAEGGAGYTVRGNRGSLFVDLAGRSTHPDAALVVFFGSRNDHEADPAHVAGMARDAFERARRVAPSAKMLVIGPPWPIAEVPENVLRIRDVLRAEAHAVGAEFVDPIVEHWFVDQPELIGADGVHPNDVGHTYMADKIVPLIGSLLPIPA